MRVSGRNQVLHGDKMCQEKYLELWTKESRKWSVKYNHIKIQKCKKVQQTDEKDKEKM